jgi:hypothetical protein
MIKLKSAQIIVVFLVLGIYSCNEQSSEDDKSLSIIRVSSDGYVLSICIPDLIKFERTTKWGDYTVNPIEMHYIQDYDTARVKIIPRYWDGQRDDIVSQEFMNKPSSQRDSTIIENHRSRLSLMQNSVNDVDFWDTTFVSNEIGMTYITTLNTDAIVLIWNGRTDFVQLKFYGFQSKDTLLEIVSSIEYLEIKPNIPSR